MCMPRSVSLWCQLVSATRRKTLFYCGIVFASHIFKLRHSYTLNAARVRYPMSVQSWTHTKTEMAKAPNLPVERRRPFNQQQTDAKLEVYLEQADEEKMYMSKQKQRHKYYYLNHFHSIYAQGKCEIESLTSAVRTGQEGRGMETAECEFVERRKQFRFIILSVHLLFLRYFNTKISDGPSFCISFNCAFVINTILSEKT